MGRDRTGVNIGLSTIGFDKSCIAYSAAYTFAYYSLLPSVLIGCYFVILRYGKGWRLVFWERRACLGIGRWEGGIQWVVVSSGDYS